MTPSHAQNTPVARTRKPVSSWGRPLALVTAGVFVISSAFPVIAGLSRNTDAFPKWFGALDVGIAFLLALLAFAVVGVAGKVISAAAEAAAYRVTRVLIHSIFALLLVFFLAGDHIVWPNCLTGFAWRYWLLLYALPYWLQAWGVGTSDGSRGVDTARAVKELY